VTYVELLTRLVSARRFGMKLGLERMRAQLDQLGAPDRRLGTVVHVAGTNGKGSTVAMIAAIARNAGKRVATYTSPHLATLRERIVIDGELASEEAIVAAADGVDPELTFFEQITAIGLRVIADAAPDITVLEVGLGGRLDATNVVAAPIGVVTGVAMDHEAILGDTLEAIAREKAGIFKPGQHAVIGGAGEPAAVPWLAAHARAAGVADVTLVEGEVAVELVGAHQRRNAATAAAVARILGLPADLHGVRHPGRFEIAGDLILDGAHNPHGARALAQTLAEQGIRPVLVIACSADKDVAAIAAALRPQVSHVVATRYQQDRALDPAALAQYFGGEHAPDLASAVERARQLGSPVLIAGSLFLVGEARVRYLGAPADPVMLTDPSARPAATCARMALPMRSNDAIGYQPSGSMRSVR
jgi:dihydrofolate synthase/folylpolyglutamate synthase